MLSCDNIFECSNRIKLWGEILRPYTYPNISENLESKIIPYKCWFVTVDGYSLCLQYSETEIDTFIIRSLQIYPVDLFSVSFHISFKIASLILDNNNLSVYLSFVKDGKKFSSWTQMEGVDGQPVEMKKQEITIKEYMGKKFAVVQNV